MSPKKLPTKPASRAQALKRCRIAVTYLQAAELMADDDGEAINVCVGAAVLAGIAAADAICIVSTGQRYSGTDHAAAAALLGETDSALGRKLASLVALKTHSHYGDDLLTAADRKKALRAGEALVAAATRATGLTA